MESDHELQETEDLDCRELLQFPITTFRRRRYMTAVDQLRQMAQIQTFCVQNVNLSFTAVLGHNGTHVCIPTAVLGCYLTRSIDEVL